jgi:hypothetical protein
MSTPQANCIQCVKRFTPWRAKQFCSESCKRKAQNARAKAKNDPEATWVADDPNPENKPPENRATPKALSTYGPLEWIACNEATLKCIREGSAAAVGWAMLVEVTANRDAWFGRIGEDFAFGPTTRPRAKAAVEARLSGRPFDKHEDSNERMWAGTCWRLLGGSVSTSATLAISGASPPDPLQQFERIQL